MSGTETIFEMFTRLTDIVNSRKALAEKYPT